MNIIEPLQTKKGLIWVQTYKIPYRDERGNIIGILGFTMDITERKKAIEELRETRDYLENLINYANAPIIVWDKETKIIRFNHAFEHLTGHASKLVIGKKLDILFPQDNKEESLKKIQRALRGEFWESVEIPIQRKDGSIRTVLWNSANIYDNQKKNLIATIAQGTDITDRKQMEEALRESESRLQRAQEISHIGSWELDLKRNYLIWSDEVYRIFGLKPREFKATYKAFLQSVHPDDRAVVDNAYTTSLREGRNTYDIEHRIIRKNGEVRFVYEKCEHLRDKTGKVVRSIGMVHDITEQKNAEAELVRLASFPEKNPMPVIEVDLSGKLQYLNPISKQLFPDLKTKGANHPFLKGINNLVLKRKKDARDTPVVREVELDNRHYLQTVINIPETKNIRIYSIDITDRKKAEKITQESEEKYRRIVENTTNVIMVTQPDGSISYLSPASATILGYSSEELIGTNPNIFHPDDAQKVHDALARALKGEKESNFEYRILTKQGEVKWISHSWSPLLINTKIQSIISVIEDITQRKNSEENIKKLNEILLHHSIDLAAANKELEAFSYSVSHDLRAPLRSIDGFSQALLEDYSDKLNDQGKDYIKRVRTATQRMGQLIDDMLRLSRLTRAELHYEPVDFSSLTLENIQKLQTVEPSRKIDIKIQRGINVNGDKKFLEILLDNLIGNAWKFTRNTKHPKIEFGKMNNETESVYFIRDNGAGFDMTYADKLFIPFQRLHSVDEFPGTGIGLAIVSRIVHRHGGRIWAESEVGKGATFYFTLEGKKVK
jgi:PAS domain S-box-containing protein